MSGMKGSLGDRPYATAYGYPDRPGYRGLSPATLSASKQAAVAVAPNAKTIAGQILALLRSRPLGMIADEVAADLEMPQPYAARPRLADLHRQGAIIDSGERRRGQSGLQQTVWRIAPPLPPNHGGAGP